MTRYANSKPRPRQTPAVCPQCGTPLKPNALACPECGSDWQTGWSEGADVDWETPDYDEILHKEFGEAPQKKPWGKIKTLLVSALALLLGALLLGVF